MNTSSFTEARPPISNNSAQARRGPQIARGGPSVKKAHYRHRPLLRACRERPSGRTTKKHDERARNKAEEGLTCIFLDNDLHFLDKDLVALVWSVLWDNVGASGEASLDLSSPL